MDTIIGPGDWWSSLIVPLGAGICLSAACGFRTFLPLLCIGLASRFGIAPLAEQFLWLASTAGLLTLFTAASVEVVGYYIPFVDNALDIIATPLAMAAGTLVMFTTLGVVTGVPAWLIALIVGGGVSGAVQVTSVKARAISSGTTAGLANPVMATGELVGAATLSVLAIIVPVVAVLLAIGTILVIWRTWRWIRRKGVPQRRIASD